MTEHHARPWWAAAVALTLLGHDVTVVDPEASEHETLWDEIEGHGEIAVLALDATGWTLTVHEREQRMVG